MQPVAGGLRERTRQAVRNELVDAALELFLVQGFDGTTVEQIATAAGLSRRSFHRYFATKDDVVAQALRATGDKIADALAERPPGEAPWIALRRGFDALVTWTAADARALPLTRIILASSALRTGPQKQPSWQQLVSAELLGRLPKSKESERQLQADALSGAALACLMTALADWVDTDGRRKLGRILDLAMSAVAPVNDE
jgi:AcrR family transcriptional regulator